MPKIPTVQADTNSKTVEMSPSISGTDFGERTGQALENLGETVTTGLYKLNDINNEVQAHKAISGAEGELQDYQQELKTGPTNDGSQVDKDGIPLPVGSPQMDPATGLPVGPPPPEQHAELMQQKIDELRDKYGDFGGFGGGAKRMFDANFDNSSRAALLQAKIHATTLLNQSIDANVQSDLATRANLAVNADPLARHTTEHETEQYIDSMAAKGVITPEQAFKQKENFVHQVELGTIRNIMKAPPRMDANGNPTGEDGATDVIRAINNGEFNKLPADVLQKNMELAINQHTHNLAQAEAADRHQEAMVDKQRKESDRQNALKLAVGYTNGSLTPQQVTSLAQRGQISPETALQYGKLASGGDNIPSDRTVKLDLLNRVFNGDDVTQDLNSAAGNRKVNPSDYMEVRKLQAEYGNTFKANPAAKQSVDWIHGMMGGDSLTKLPAQNAAEANAKQEFFNYVKENPKANPTQLQDYAQQVVKRASIFDRDTMGTTMLAPRFYPGTKAQLMQGGATFQDMQKAYNDTVAAHAKGAISDADLRREKDLISQWTKNYNLQPGTQQPVKK